MKGRQYALFKRALEYYEADPVFRKSLQENPEGTVSTVGIPAEDGKEVLEAISVILMGKASEQDKMPYVQLWLERNRKQIGFSLHAMGGGRYRNQQIFSCVSAALERERMESLEFRWNQQIRFVPLAFELSQGCKVQCPFCGFNAEAWKKNYSYRENAQLWQSILRSAKEYLGDIVDQAPLYFATEPLDHPAYESFLQDVEALGGLIPQTTTAAADRDVKRTKELMALLGERRLCEESRLRFSIRTLSQFMRVMKAFSPEELAGVELILNNPESVHMISSSGRVRNKASFRERIHADYSISCLCGVKVNLCDSSMIYMEPELPDDQSPLGIRVRGETFYTDAASFDHGLRKLYESYAVPVPRRDQKLILNRHVQVSWDTEKITMTGKGAGYYLARNIFTEQLTKAFADQNAGCSIGELAARMHLNDRAEQDLQDLINTLYQKGYLISFL